MKGLVLLSLFLFCFVSAFGAEPVLWPIDIEISQSSSFAEMRGMRHHAGIDLRTSSARDSRCCNRDDTFRE